MPRRPEELIGIVIDKAADTPELWPSRSGEIERRTPSIDLPK